MPKPKKIAPRAKPRPAAPKTSPAVYTVSPLPSLGAPNWDTGHTTQAALAFAFGYHRSYGRGSAIAADGLDLRDWWHAALADRDAATLSSLRAAVDANNSEVRALASGLDLTVKIHTSDAARVLQFDALAMSRRIEAASAKHKNKGPRNHAGANRHLAYHCPVCSVSKTKPDGSVQWSNTVRASAPDRIMMCAGRYGAQHEPALMVFDESSQPAYRLEDKYGHADDLEGDAAIDRAMRGVGGTGGHTKTISQYRQARAPRQIVNAAGIVQNNPAPRDDDIPF